MYNDTAKEKIKHLPICTYKVLVNICTYNINIYADLLSCTLHFMEAFNFDSTEYKFMRLSTVYVSDSPLYLDVHK